MVSPRGGFDTWWEQPSAASRIALAAGAFAAILLVALALVEPALARARVPMIAAGLLLAAATMLLGLRRARQRSKVG